MRSDGSTEAESALILATHDVGADGACAGNGLRAMISTNDLAARRWGKAVTVGVVFIRPVPELGDTLLVNANTSGTACEPARLAATAAHVRGRLSAARPARRPCCCVPLPTVVR